jgi:hypothetical protein
MEPQPPHGQHPSHLWLGPMHWFSDWPIGEVPQAGSLVYTIWDRSDAFVYVGISGRTVSVSAKSKGPLGRLASHASGRRSGDQFLIYVCDGADRLTLPSRKPPTLPEIRRPRSPRQKPLRRGNAEKWVC